VLGRRGTGRLPYISDCFFSIFFFGKTGPESGGGGVGGDEKLGCQEEEEGSKRRRRIGRGGPVTVEGGQRSGEM